MRTICLLAVAACGGAPPAKPTYFDYSDDPQEKAMRQEFGSGN